MGGAGRAEAGRGEAKSSDCMRWGGVGGGQGGEGYGSVCTSFIVGRVSASCAQQETRSSSSGSVTHLGSLGRRPPSTTILWNVSFDTPEVSRK